MRLSCRPFISIETGDKTSASFRKYSENLPDVVCYVDTREGEVRFELIDLGFAAVRSLQLLFERLCGELKLRIVLDWDNLDDGTWSEPFPYISLERPANMTDTRLLWPDE